MSTNQNKINNKEITKKELQISNSPKEQTKEKNIDNLKEESSSEDFKTKINYNNEEINKISIGIRNAIKEHPESYSSTNVNGRVKHYLYNGIQLDGLWELEVAKYLDNKNIKWERPKNGFEYNWNNSNHIYFPDFYLPKYNYYIEVKGYQRERDLYKWASLNNLIIIKQKEIEKIRNNQYDISIYLI